MTETHRVRPHPEHRPRLIATDLDGTLLADDRTVSRRTLDALAAASDAGIETVFVTGRPARWLEVVSAVRDRTVAICANGAAVADLTALGSPAGDTVSDLGAADRAPVAGGGLPPSATPPLIEVHQLRPADARALAAVLRGAVPGITFAVERTTGMHYEPDYPTYFPGAVAGVAPIEKLLDDTGEFADQPIIKLLARHSAMDPDRLLAATRAAAPGLGEFTRSSASALVEISARGVSKATTLSAYCARRGLGPQDVVAFGDMPNDLEMLAWAGRSYAMANAHPDVLAAATHRTAANTEDGVARAVERLLADLARPVPAGAGPAGIGALAGGRRPELVDLDQRRCRGRREPAPRARRPVGGSQVADGVPGGAA
ncbi:HAD family hydrolase, partial [Streptomyces lonarensis]|uniref:HAD family hydrolase n=1 Tax=Streptomyces lonarensis TaxID=700599 RepID=UPI0028A946D6